jgi:hypothetical protein
MCMVAGNFSPINLCPCHKVGITFSGALLSKYAVKRTIIKGDLFSWVESCI